MNQLMTYQFFVFTEPRQASPSIKLGNEMIPDTFIQDNVWISK